MISQRITCLPINLRENYIYKVWPSYSARPKQNKSIFTIINVANCLPKKMHKITNYTPGIYARDIWPNIPNIPLKVEDRRYPTWKVECQIEPSQEP